MKPTSNAHADDSRAVSPVIGVILMVAITVILASVIGTFVLGVGQQSLQTQPHAAMDVADADGNYDPGSASPFVTLTHSGGDSIELANTKIVVRSSSGVVDTWSGDWTRGYFTSLSADRTVSTGEVITLETSSSVPASEVPDDSQYTIVVVHESSGAIVAQGTVDVR